MELVIERPKICQGDMGSDAQAWAARGARQHSLKRLIWKSKNETWHWHLFINISSAPVSENLSGSLKGVGTALPPQRGRNLLNCCWYVMWTSPMACEDPFPTSVKGLDLGCSIPHKRGSSPFGEGVSVWSKVHRNWAKQSQHAPPREIQICFLGFSSDRVTHFHSASLGFYLRSTAPCQRFIGALPHPPLSSPSCIYTKSYLTPVSGGWSKT